MAADPLRPALPRTLQIWDISPAVDEQAEVFPGDTAYAQQPHFSLSPCCAQRAAPASLEHHLLP